MIIKRWDSIANRQFTPNFKLREFFCFCNICSEQKVSRETVELLQKLRDIIKEPVAINSAYRCENWNKKKGGAPESRHLFGDAVDIFVFNKEPIEIAHLGYMLGFKGIGVGSTFTHLDTRPVSKTVIWEYNNNKPVEASEETLRRIYG